MAVNRSPDDDAGTIVETPAAVITVETPAEEPQAPADNEALRTAIRAEVIAEMALEAATSEPEEPAPWQQIQEQIAQLSADTALIREELSEVHQQIELQEAEEPPTELPNTSEPTPEEIAAAALLLETPELVREEASTNETLTEASSSPQTDSLAVNEDGSPAVVEPVIVVEEHVARPRVLLY